MDGEWRSHRRRDCLQPYNAVHIGQRRRVDIQCHGQQRSRIVDKFDCNPESEPDCPDLGLCARSRANLWQFRLPCYGKLGIQRSSDLRGGKRPSNCQRQHGHDHRRRPDCVTGEPSCSRQLCSGDNYRQFHGGFGSPGAHLQLDSSQDLRQRTVPSKCKLGI